MGCRYVVDGAVQLNVDPLASHMAGQRVCDGRRPAVEANLGGVEGLSSPVVRYIARGRCMSYRIAYLVQRNRTAVGASECVDQVFAHDHSR